MHTQTLFHIDTKKPLCTDLLTHSERQGIQWFWFHGFHPLLLAGNAKGRKQRPEHSTWPPLQLPGRDLQNLLLNNTKITEKGTGSATSEPAQDLQGKL